MSIPSAKKYRRIAKRHLLSRWPERKRSELSRMDVVKLHREMADAPYAANRTIALLSKFFNWCEAQGIRPDHSNPCRHVEKYREDKRERFLSTEELARLGQVLDEEEKRAGSLPWIVGAFNCRFLQAPDSMKF
jgi:integrase